MENRYVYSCSAIPSKPDVRDYSVHVQRPVALPASFKQPISSNYNQGAGNCVMQTYRSIMRAIFGIEFGVDMGYGGFRKHDSAGMYPNVAANGLCQYGIAPAKYDSGEREVQAVITYYNANKKALHEHAAPYKGLTWGRATTADQIKQSLYNGLYVAGCFAISQWDTDSKGIFPCKSSTHGYHEMRIYGWDRINGQEYACVQNSWGRSWGLSGECYISWEDVLRVGDIIVFTPPKDKGKDDDGDTVIRRTLRKGMRGDDVKQLQKKLSDLGYVLAVDGIFGSGTRSQVKKYQRKNGLEADGIVGPKTWEALDNE